MLFLIIFLYAFIAVLKLKPQTETLNDPQIIIQEILIPIFAIFAIIGNLVNASNFLKRFMIIKKYSKNLKSSYSLTKSRYAIEKATLFELSAWSISNCLSCLVIVPQFFIPKRQAFYCKKSFAFYFEMYGPTIGQIFRCEGTWLAVLAVCTNCICIRNIHQAHTYVSLRNLTTMVFFSITFISLGHIPMLFKYQVKSLPEVDIYSIVPGWLHGKQEHFFSWTWLIAGYLLPLVLSISCMAKIIRTLLTCQIRSQKTKKAIKRAAILVSANVVFLLLFQTPYQIFTFFSLLKVLKSPSHAMFYRDIVELLTVLHYSLNSFIHCILESSTENSLCVKKHKSYSSAKVRKTDDWSMDNQNINMDN